MTTKSKNINMLEGSIFKGVIAYAIPLMLSRILQLAYNAADLIVVGNFAENGTTSLAAVGSTSSLINLIINFFATSSIGVTMLVSKYFGARDYTKVQKTVHTSVAFSLVCGIICAFIGFLFSKDFLAMMGSPDDVIDKAALYLEIYFIGVPALLLYNYGAAILMAVGDTKSPLYILTIAGLANVVINFVTVVFFNMDVAGVALGTTVSNYLSAALVVYALMRADFVYKLHIKKIRFHTKEMLEIFRFGLPAGIQSALVSFSNVLIQSSINSFGSKFIAANSAGNNIEGFVYTILHSFAKTSTAFISQNYGAKNYKRIYKSHWVCHFYNLVMTAPIGLLVATFGKTLISFYNQDPEVMVMGNYRLWFISGLYFVLGIYEILLGAIRGMGYSFIPMCVSIFGMVICRIVYIKTVFAHFHTPAALYLSYLSSWILVSVILTVVYICAKRKLDKQMINESLESEQKQKEEIQA